MSSSIFNRPAGRTDTDFRVIPDSFTDEAFRGEYDGSNNLIYKGFGRPGSDTSLPVWQLAFLTYDGSGNILTIQWPLAVNNLRSISSEAVGTVTTPFTSFSGTLSFVPILPGTVTITVGALTFTETGTITAGVGALSAGGSNTGTIGYKTGALSLTINPALGGNTAVTASYQTYTLSTASNDYQFVWNYRTAYTYA